MNTYNIIPKVLPQAVVGCCSDARLSPDTMRNFLARQLKIYSGQYFPLIAGGGGGLMARPGAPRHLHDFRFMRSQLELFCKYYPIRRVVLISPQDCTYYKDLATKSPTTMKYHTHMPLDDMRLLPSIFSQLLSHLNLELELYYARFVDLHHTKVMFQRVH